MKLIMDVKARGDCFVKPNLLPEVVYWISYG